MWPFHSKQTNSLQKSQEKWTADAFNAVRAFGPVGMEFNYLGRRCVITGHSELHYRYPSPPKIVPVVKFDYVDDVGTIRSRVAYVKELPALIAQRDAGA